MLRILRRIVVLAAISIFLLLPSSGNGASSGAKKSGDGDPVQCPIEDQQICQSLGGTMNPRTCRCE